jgi:MFS family permease
MLKRLPAFESSDYRLWFVGQSISLIGTWMQNVGQSWLVLQLTNSPLKLGLLTSVQFIPTLLLSVFIGPVIDRFPKRSVLLFTQIMFALNAAALTILAFSGHILYWHVLLIASVTGVIQAIDMPTRQAFVTELVHDRSAVANAVALNSAMFNIARIVGPGIGGLLIAAVGIPWTFAANGISFVSVIVSLLYMKAGRKALDGASRSYLKDVREGIGYVRRNRIVLTLLIIVGVLSLFLLNFNILIPTFAQLALGLSAEGYGGLVSAMGAGALGAALLMSLRGRRLEPKPAYVLAAGFLLSVAMILVGLQRSIWVTGLLLMCCGFGMASLTMMCNTGLQMQAPDHMRGRVMAAYNLVFTGSTPFGALYAGEICEALGPGTGFLVSGIIGLVFMFLILGFVAPRVFAGVTTLAVRAAGPGQVRSASEAPDEGGAGRGSFNI